MPFDTVSDKEKKTFDKIPFLTFDYGNHIIRILGKDKTVYTHYIKSANVVLKCLGEDCPICKNNSRIIAEHPNDYKEVPGINFRNIKHYFNCLDRTEVKTCKDCGEEVKRDQSQKFPTVCRNGHLITDAEPHISNRVKVASISETNAVLINTHEAGILDKDGNIIGYNGYDFLFIVTRSGNKKNITPMPMSDRNDVVEVADEFLYDLDKAVVTLTAEEILAVLQGVSLRDVYLARAGKKTDTVLQETALNTSEDIKNKVSILFGKD